MFTKFTFAFLIAFSSGLFNDSLLNETNQLELRIEQNGEFFPIKKMNDKVLLSKEKFTLNFKLEKDDEVAEKYFAARMVADIDPEIFDQFEVGKSLDEIPSLALGTSMAGPKDSPYECLFFNDQAHHYIFYSSEEEKRAHLISQEEDLLELSFDIENYCMQDLEVNIQNSNFEKMFLVFFIDKNLNDQLDEGEFIQLELQFENTNTH